MVIQDTIENLFTSMFVVINNSKKCTLSKYNLPLNMFDFLHSDLHMIFFVHVRTTFDPQYIKGIYKKSLHSYCDIIKWYSRTQLYLHDDYTITIFIANYEDNYEFFFVEISLHFDKIFKTKMPHLEL